MIDLTKNSSVKNCLIKVCFRKLKNLMLPRNNPLNLEVILERSFHWELYHITFSHGVSHCLVKVNNFLFHFFECYFPEVNF